MNNVDDQKNIPNNIMAIRKPLRSSPEAPTPLNVLVGHLVQVDDPNSNIQGIMYQNQISVGTNSP